MNGTREENYLYSPGWMGLGRRTICILRDEHDKGGEVFVTILLRPWYWKQILGLRLTCPFYLQGNMNLTNPGCAGDTNKSIIRGQINFSIVSILGLIWVYCFRCVLISPVQGRYCDVSAPGFPPSQYISHSPPARFRFPIILRALFRVSVKLKTRRDISNPERGFKWYQFTNLVNTVTKLFFFLKRLVIFLGNMFVLQ